PGALVTVCPPSMGLPQSPPSRTATVPPPTAAGGAAVVPPALGADGAPLQPAATTSATTASGASGRMNQLLTEAAPPLSAGIRACNEPSIARDLARSQVLRERQV